MAWSASILTGLAAGQAIGVELTLAQGALLSSGVALVTIVPSGPGYVGTFELTAVSILSTFGVPTDQAFALALLVHVMILAVTSVGGVIAALRLHVGLGRLVRGAGRDRSSADAPAPPVSSAPSA